MDKNDHWENDHVAIHEGKIDNNDFTRFPNFVYLRQKEIAC